MAGIDKTYVNKEQLKEAVEWAKNIGVVTLENGHKFKPLNWIESYNDIHNPEFWNEENEWYILSKSNISNKYEKLSRNGWRN